MTSFLERMQAKVPCLMSRKTSFVSMIFLLSTFFLLEVVVGYITHSMALIAESFHMLSDVASLIVAWLALKYSSKQAPRDKYTYGFARAEVLGALVNAVFLVALCFSIFIEAVKRLVLVEEIENPLLVFCVGAAGLVVNIFGMFLFYQTGHGHGHGGTGGSHGHGGDGGQTRKHPQGHGHSHQKPHQHSHSHGGDHSHFPYKGHSPTVAQNEQDDRCSSREATEEEEICREECEDVENKECESFEGEEEKEKLLKNENKGKNTADSSINLEDSPAQPQTQSAGQLNIHAVYLHILGDALGSVIVMGSALIIMFAEGTWTLYVDPVMSIIMVMIILKTSIPLLVNTSKILMNSVPNHIQVTDMKERMLKQIPQIKNVHELHVWQLAGDRIIASVHVRFATPEDYEETALKIKEFFHNEGIHSTTVQIEFERSNVDEADRRSECNVLCSLDRTCDEMLCCIPDGEEGEGGEKKEEP